DQQQPRGTQLASDETEQRQRRLVGPVKILEHHQQRLAGGGTAKKARHGVEQLESRLGVSPSRRNWLDVGAARPQGGGGVGARRAGGPPLLRTCSVCRGCIT